MWGQITYNGYQHKTPNRLYLQIGTLFLKFFYTFYEFSGISFLNKVSSTSSEVSSTTSSNKNG